MEAFADFILQVTYPPNPIRELDNSLRPDEAAGRDFFFENGLGNGVIPGPGATCANCHELDVQYNVGDDAPGFFGADGRSSFDFAPQLFKVPHLRNLYQKVGMFGMGQSPVFTPGDNGPKGDQVRGFGYAHDGALDTVFRFHSTIFFAPPFSPDGFTSDQQKQQVQAFLLAMDSNMAPIVGQQITVRKHHAATAAPRLALLRQRAEEGECELVAKTRLFGRETGFLYLQNGTFTMDVQAAPPLSPAALVALSAVRPVTFTCVPLGSGVRAGLDRDGDGALDGDEALQGTGPADPTSTP
jgi:hypothetical protein